LLPLVLLFGLAALAGPAAGQGAADRLPPLDAAVEICHGLLPGFVRWPRDLEVVTRPGSGDSPTGVSLSWSDDAADATAGSGYIRCWFLPPETTNDAWQIGTVDSSKYGTLTRYDVQQLNKFLRLRPSDPQRIKVDRDSPWMPLLYLLQQSINAASLGGLYALIAVGFTLIYASGRVVNFAIGEIFTIGAFLAMFGYVLHRAGGGWLAASLLSPVLVIAVSGACGWAMHRMVFSRLAGRGPLPPLIAAIGLSIVLREAILLLHGPKTRWLPPLEGWSWPLVQGLGFDVFFSIGHVAILVATGAAAAGLWWVGRMTRIGRSFRAATEDSAAAALMGVPIERLFAAAFALGAAFAGSAGGFAAWYYGPVDFYMGAMVGLKALTAAVVGGMGSVPGAFAGGLAVAAVEVAAATLIGGAWRDIVVFGLLVLFLIFRPQGLLGPPADPFGALRGAGQPASRPLDAC
jgi:branched-chain amino acid transport system permease protein